MGVKTMMNAYDRTTDITTALVKEAINRYGVPVDVFDAYNMAEKLYPAVVDMRKQIRGTTLMDMARTARESGVSIKPAKSRIYEVDHLFKAILRVSGLGEDAMKVSLDKLDDATKAVIKTSGTIGQIAEVNEDLAKDIMTTRMIGTISRHVLAASRQAVADTARHGSGRTRSGRRVKLGYARVLQGDKNCGFCAMLASRGAIYPDDHTAIWRKDGHKYHDWCNCVSRLVYKGESWEGQEEADMLYALWKDSEAKSVSQFDKVWRKEKDKSLYTPVK